MQPRSTPLPSARHRHVIGGLATQRCCPRACRHQRDLRSSRPSALAAAGSQAQPVGDSVRVFLLHGTRVSLLATGVVLSVLFGRQVASKVSPIPLAGATPATVATAAAAQVRAVYSEVHAKPLVCNALISTVTLFLLINSTIAFIEASAGGVSGASTSTGAEAAAKPPAGAQAGSNGTPASGTSASTSGRVESQKSQNGAVAPADVAPKHANGVAAAHSPVSASGRVMYDSRNGFAALGVPVTAATVHAASSGNGRNGHSSSIGSSSNGSISINGSGIYDSSSNGSRSNNGSSSNGISNNGSSSSNGSSSGVHAANGHGREQKPSAGDPVKLVAALAWAFADTVNGKGSKK